MKGTKKILFGIALIHFAIAVNIIGNEVDELGLILCGIPTVLGLIIAIAGLFNKSDE